MPGSELSSYSDGLATACTDLLEAFLAYFWAISDLSLMNNSKFKIHVKHRTEKLKSQWSGVKLSAHPHLSSLGLYAPKHLN